MSQRHSKAPVDNRASSPAMPASSRAFSTTSGARSKACTSSQDRSPIRSGLLVGVLGKGGERRAVLSPGPQRRPAVEQGRRPLDAQGLDVADDTEVPEVAVVVVEQGVDGHHLVEGLVKTGDA